MTNHDADTKPVPISVGAHVHFDLAEGLAVGTAIVRDSAYDDDRRRTRGGGCYKGSPHIRARNAVG